MICSTGIILVVTFITFFFFINRLLQLNLFNESDTLSLYDGSIYNVSSPLINVISSKSFLKNQFVTTNSSSFSVKMVVSGAAQQYGFIAEIVTLPISAITFSKF